MHCTPQAKLKELAKIGVCPRDLACIATAALSKWRLTQMAPLGAQHLVAGVDAWLRPLSSRPSAVAGMSALQVGLLVAAQRLEDRGLRTFNFEVRECVGEGTAGWGTVVLEGRVGEAATAGRGAVLLEGTWLDFCAPFDGRLTLWHHSGEEHVQGTSTVANPSSYYSTPST